MRSDGVAELLVARTPLRGGIVHVLESGRWPLVCAGRGRTRQNERAECRLPLELPSPPRHAATLGGLVEPVDSRNVKPMETVRRMGRTLALAWGALVMVACGRKDASPPIDMTGVPAREGTIEVRLLAPKTLVP